MSKIKGEELMAKARDPVCGRDIDTETAVSRRSNLQERRFKPRIEIPKGAKQSSNYSDPIAKNCLK